MGGNYIESSERDFIARGVVVGVSTLYNQTSGLSALVGGVTASRITTLGLGFSPGDFWRVSLNTPWTVQNDNGPIVDIQCKRCGWSYPQKTLVNGLCPTCIDKLRV